jgi:hypothetical protein
LIVITLTENSGFSNFEYAVERAKMMPLLDERELTTNDNHKMYWSAVNVAGFKQYEGIIDYGDERGLVVSIKGLSETADMMTGEKVPGFSENEYLDIFRSFKFVESESASQSTKSDDTSQVHALNQQTEVPEDNQPTSDAKGTVIVAFRDLPVGIKPLGTKNVGHAGVAFQNEDGTWTAGAVEGPGFPFQILSALPGMENGAWVEYFNDNSQVIEEFSNKGYEKIKTIDVFSDTDPAAAQKVMDGFFSRGYDVELNNCLTATHEVLEAYGCKYLPSAFDNILGRSTTPISYFNQLAGVETNIEADTELDSDTSQAAPSSDTSAASDISGDANTKTAYTKDGINFISEERVEQNIRHGWANLGEYEKVQVPLDTVVAEPSPE